MTEEGSWWGMIVCIIDESVRDHYTLSAKRDRTVNNSSLCISGPENRNKQTNKEFIWNVAEILLKKLLSSEITNPADQLGRY